MKKLKTNLQNQNAFKQLEEWGINLSARNKWFTSLLPFGFLWRLTFLNTLVIIIATAFSGWAIYNTACFLAAGVGDFDSARQQHFNRTLLGYLWVFMFIVAITASVLHFFLTKRLLKPIHSLMASTEQLKQGHYPDPIEVYKRDEIGQLVIQYNELIKQLQMNEQHRKTFVSDLSHEIRTPLANLDGYLQALKDGAITGDEALFTSLHQEANRLSQMVAQLEQLKEWDHVSAQLFSNKKATDISEVVKQCASMFQWTLDQKNIALQVHAAPCTLSIHVEGIQQAISNLLDNAILYYEGTGPIVLTGEVQDSHYKIAISGPGHPIQEAEKDNVFKRFYRLDSSRSRDTGGSGLGLAITKKIVEQHHQGEIGIETTYDSNTFWIMLLRGK